METETLYSCVGYVQTFSLNWIVWIVVRYGTETLNFCFKCTYILDIMNRQPLKPFHYSTAHREMMRAGVHRIHLYNVHMNLHHLSFIRLTIKWWIFNNLILEFRYEICDCGSTRYLIHTCLFWTLLEWVDWE